MKQIVQSNPNQLHLVKSMIGDKNPALLTKIKANQDEFLQLMNEGKKEIVVTASTTSNTPVAASDSISKIVTSDTDSAPEDTLAFLRQNYEIFREEAAKFKSERQKMANDRKLQADAWSKKMSRVQLVEDQLEATKLEMLETVRKQHAAIVEGHRVEVENLKGLCEDHQKLAEKATKDLQALRKDLDAKTTDFMQLTEESADRETRLKSQRHATLCLKLRVKELEKNLEDADHQLHEQNKTVADRDRQVRDEQVNRAKDLAELKGKVETQRQTITDLEEALRRSSQLSRKLEMTLTERDETMKLTEEKFQHDLAAKNNQNKGALDAARLQTDTVRKSLSDIKNKCQLLQEREGELELDLTKVRGALKTAKSAAETINRDKSKELEMMEIRLEREVEQTRKDCEGRIAQMSEVSLEKISRCQNDNDDLRRQIVGLKARTLQQKNAFRRETAELVESHDAALITLKEAHKLAMDQRAADSLSRTMTLSKEHDAALSSLQKRLEVEVRLVEDARAALIENFKSREEIYRLDAEATKNRLEQELKISVRKRDALVSDYESRLARAGDAIENLKVKHGEHIAKADAMFHRELQKLQETHAKEKQELGSQCHDLQRELEDIQNRHRRTIDGLKEEHGLQIISCEKKILAEAERNLMKVKDEYSQGLANSRKREKVADDVVSELRATLKVRDDSLSDFRNRLQVETEAAAAAASKHRRDLQITRDKCEGAERSLDEFKIQLEKEIEEMANKCRDSVAAADQRTKRAKERGSVLDTTLSTMRQEQENLIAEVQKFRGALEVAKETVRSTEELKVKELSTMERRWASEVACVRDKQNRKLEDAMHSHYDKYI